MIDSAGILSAVVSHAASLGRFERVNGHEPKNAPGQGLSVAVWVEGVAPVPQGSGLASTAATVTLSVRVYANMLGEPQDGIDPGLVSAVDTLMNAYSSNFTLGGLVRNVDLLGQAGAPLRAEAGYLEQDGKLYRVMVITLPMILNDVWSQSA